MPSHTWSWENWAVSICLIKNIMHVQCSAEWQGTEGPFLENWVYKATMTTTSAFSTHLLDLEYLFVVGKNKNMENRFSKLDSKWFLSHLTHCGVVGEWDWVWFWVDLIIIMQDDLIMKGWLNYSESLIVIVYCIWT